MIPDGVVISFNGQIDFGTVVALLALALTLVQWICLADTGPPGGRAEPGISHLCPCGQDA